jgi:O-antigen ligase
LIVKDRKYIFNIIFHIILGIAVFILKDVSKIYALIIFALGLFYVIIKKNKNEEALYMSAYVIGSEILIRMTDGVAFYEFAKYYVILLLVIGIIYRGFSKLSLIYWIYILLLLPGVFYGMYQLNYGTDIRKAIAFNIVGPLCLGVTAIYCYKRPISFNQLINIVISLGLPMVSVLTYVILYKPSVREVVTATYSNFQTSGGFGPNQMSTILGLGMFVFFSLTLFKSKNKLVVAINFLITILFAYRCLVTFSRGGMITGVIMILLLLMLVFFKSNSKGKSKISSILVVTSIIAVSIWIYSLSQTNGMIQKRYANQDAQGRVKESKLTGRETLIESELDMFWENPIFGVGVGKNLEYREETTGIRSVTHNEISRMLAEHGFFGVACLLILLIVPPVLYFNNKQHVLLFSFFIFWLLTINHAAMRLAAPGFIYGLSLLKVNFIENTSD